MDTDFASPERASPDQWSREAAVLADHPLVTVLLDSVGGHLVLLNAQRQVVAANAEFLALVGHLTLDQIPGRRLGELLACRNAFRTEGGCGTTSDCAHCGAVLAILEVLEKGVPSETECHLCLDQGGRIAAREFRVKATPLEVGGQRFVVFVFHDISSDKRRQALERVFFHDLKNLLGGLIGMGEILARSHESRAASTIVRLSQLLNGEVEAQILLSRAESGDHQPHPNTFLLETLLADLQGLFEVHACARGKTLSLEVPGPLTLVADQSVLFRVLVNMLKNAFEATPVGEGVRLAVKAQEPGLLFTVSNPGVLAPDVAPRIFERSFSTKGQGGRGLGTYSMRLFAEGFLGGRVWFTSEEGEGTRFFLSIP